MEVTNTPTNRGSASAIAVIPTQHVPPKGFLD
jgi:hypothetical protein